MVTDKTWKAMLKAAKGGDHVAALAALDRLREAGHDGLADALAQQWVGDISPELKAMKAEYTAEQIPLHFAALTLHEALERVDLGAVPVVSADRHIPRKEQAALPGQLFRSLGLAGISVTAPDYAFAQDVDVNMPYRHDFAGDGDPVWQANQRARERLRNILSVAFPNHDDRSNAITDDFD